MTKADKYNDEVQENVRRQVEELFQVEPIAFEQAVKVYVKAFQLFGIEETDLCMPSKDFSTWTIDGGIGCWDLIDSSTDQWLGSLNVQGGGGAELYLPFLKIPLLVAVEETA